MALKPTIFKIRISLSDFNHDYYDALNLTLAQHPSETIERMMVRVLAYCLNAHEDHDKQEQLVFTKGLSSIDEPDIWLKTLDNQIIKWIEVGEPASDRVKKATHLSKVVKIYCFNSKADVWWSQSQRKLNVLDVSVYAFDWESVVDLSKLVSRTMDVSINISDDSVYVAAEQGECELKLTTLKE